MREGGIGAVCRAFVAIVLLSAGASKLTQRDRFLRALAALPWMPLRVARPASVLIPAVEVALASALVVVPRQAAVAAIALIGAFTVVIARELAVGRRFRCGCFGGAGVRVAGVDALVRNSLLLLAAGVVVVDAPGGWTPATLTGIGLGLLLLLYEIGTETLALARQR